MKQKFHIPISSAMLCRGIGIICAVLLFSHCKHAQTEPPKLFELVDSSGIQFNNVVVDSRIDNSFYFRNFYNGGGVATGDVNNDGLADVLLTSNMGDNKLYLNKGNWKFADISMSAGLRQDSLWNTGAVMADVNNDGWLDIYICSSGRIYDSNRVNKLYINNHDLSFTEQAAAYGLNHSGYCTQASFFDYDADGDLDCLLINNSPIPFSSLSYAGMRDVDIDKWDVPSRLKGGGNHLYRNDNNHFSEVTRKAGLHTGLISFGLGVSVGDINGDDYPDIYVGNDFIEKDYLYINQRDGTFKDELENYVQHISMSSMSTDLGDINNDGYPEILTTDMIPDDDYRLKTTGTFDNIDLYLSKQKAGLYHQFVRNCLQLNNGNGTFSDIANYTGIYGTDWSWGAVFLDADNDGFNDIFICNGINKDVGDLDFLDYFSNDVYQKMLATGKRDDIGEVLKHIPTHALANRVFRNTGNLGFTDIGKQWGLDQPSFSNSIAYADLDNDGDLDLVINNENQPAFVYRNNSREQNANNYIAIQLQGTASNTHAIGAKIRAFAKGQVFYRELSPVRGFQSCMEYKQIIGLGKLTGLDSLVITWPDRGRTVLMNPALNKLHAIREENELSAAPSVKTAGNELLLTVAVSMDKHVEDEQIDFYNERNLPEQLSSEGPRIAAADVNGDGLEDVYIGGAKDQPGQLYLQADDGFIKKEEQVFNQYAYLEDIAVLFFDADSDGDKDLFIGAGGNVPVTGNRELPHRLYINDGKGNFSIDVKAFPFNAMNIAVAASYDFDKDGDEDLFVGSRSVPLNYGLKPVSYLYRNDGHGHFTDVTKELAPELVNAGMITAASWADIDADGQSELIITGEWMQTRIYRQEPKTRRFHELKNTGLEKFNGLWRSLAVDDLNGDGLADLVIGNMGENFYLRPTGQEPVKLWLNDFDGNGTTEQFLTRSLAGKDMPVFLKREITDQFPGLKKQNLKHSEYATKSIQELFGPEIIAKAAEREFNYCSSIIAINEGNGHFRVEALPQRLQLSSINAILLQDLDGDGRKDILAGGNLFTFPPQFGRLDAGYGELLLNDGKAGWGLVEPQTSGISIKGQIKDIRVVNGKGKKFILVVRNDESPLLYQLKSR